MIKYEVYINDNGNEEWRLNGQLHRENGPAFTYANGMYVWYLEGKWFSKEGYNKEMAKRKAPSCSGKVVEIDGKKYKLQEIT